MLQAYAFYQFHFLRKSIDPPLPAYGKAYTTWLTLILLFTTFLAIVLIEF